MAKASPQLAYGAPTVDVRSTALGRASSATSATPVAPSAALGGRGCSPTWWYWRPSCGCRAVWVCSYRSLGGARPLQGTTWGCMLACLPCCSETAAVQCMQRGRRPCRRLGLARSSGVRRRTAGAREMNQCAKVAVSGNVGCRQSNRAVAPLPALDVAAVVIDALAARCCFIDRRELTAATRSGAGSMLLAKETPYAAPAASVPAAPPFLTAIQRGIPMKV